MSTKIQLRQEIMKSDALRIADWLEEVSVIQYLNEELNVSDSIRQTIARVNMPILTPLFNRNCSFFIITNQEQPVGFLRLVPSGDISEIVVVIGDTENWSKGFGYKAILHGLNHAFFTLRKKRVVARIHDDNVRSQRAFRKAGFIREKDYNTGTQFYISVEQFLKLA